MATITRPHPETQPEWLQPHACAEDRAMGLELELIELVRRRDQEWGRADETEREIAEILRELADV